MTGYEFDLNVGLDPVYVNAREGGHYIAWQIGRNPQTQRALWVITPIVVSPVALSTLLPADYVSYSLTTDVQAYGFTRSFAPAFTILNVQKHFNIMADALAVAE